MRNQVCGWGMAVAVLLAGIGFSTAAAPAEARSRSDFKRYHKEQRKYFEKQQKHFEKRQKEYEKRQKEHAKAQRKYYERQEEARKEYLKDLRKGRGGYHRSPAYGGYPSAIDRPYGYGGGYRAYSCPTPSRGFSFGFDLGF